MPTMSITQLFYRFHPGRSRPMKDRSKYGATKAPTLIAAALILAGGAGLARAEEPADKDPAEAASAAAPNAAAPNAAAPSEATPSETAPSEATPGETAPSEAAPGEEEVPTVVLPAAPAVVAPPALLPLPAAPAPAPAPSDSESVPASWFARPPLTVVAGEGDRQFKLTFFGFAEVDYIYDSTRSYDDDIGSSLVAREDTYNGNHSRSQFSMRNSRLGFAFESPTVGGVTPSAVLEADFFGHQESPPETSESTYFDSPTFRVRHAYVKLQNPYVDVLLGQTYDVFGWQNFSYPCSVQFLGLPNQLFSRNPQLRLSHSFGADGPLGVDIAISAGRPAQRDSQIPDGSAGLRINVNRWKGLSTPGNVGTRVLPAAIGVSGIVRSFKVNAFAPPPVRNSNSITGWGMAVDAFLPVIPAASEGDRSNRLTLTGSFVLGTGIADLITSGGGATFRPLPNPGQIIPWPVYESNIDSTLVTFDADGVAHTLNWMAFRVGLQYYLPPSGRLLFSANYTQSHSDNLHKFYLPGDSTIELLGNIADTTRYADVNLFWDVTPAIRLGLSGQYTQVEYLDKKNKPHNLRGMAQTVYQF
jgi:hypothetical protein